MRDQLRALTILTILTTACEDGPDLIFTPNDADPTQQATQNGHKPGTPYTPQGVKGYSTLGGADNVARAQFCNNEENEAVVQMMVQQPVIPDVSVGGVPLRAADGSPLYADDLLGKGPGKFCDPTGVYSNAFTWGPTNEIIVFFNEETRLVEAVDATQQYLGKLEGDYTDGSGAKVHIEMSTRNRAKIGGRELDQYTSRADQASRPNAWLNNQNVTAIYKMIRETFFDAAPFPADFDCVASKLCDLLYLSGADTTPQDTAIRMDDTGMIIVFSPEGQVTDLYAQPVRVSPFELRAQIKFGEPASPTMAFNFQSETKASCSISLDDQPTFATFRDRCVDAGDERTLARAQYETEDGRDSVLVSFAGLDMAFVRDVGTRPVFRDRERPSDDDKLYAFNFTRTLQAPVAEYQPRTLATNYVAALRQRLIDSIDPAGGIDPLTHPLATMPLVVPFGISNNATRIGEIKGAGTDSNWVEEIVAAVIAEYNSLSPTDREVVDTRVSNPVFLLEPFVDVVMQAFSHGESEGPDAFKVFRTTDDQRWCIGIANFKHGGVPYRVQVQYSLNFGAITAIFVERGFNRVDEAFNAVAEVAGRPYYDISLAADDSHPLGLGGDGVTVRGFDRQLDTLDVTIKKLKSDGTTEDVQLTVAGSPVVDMNGYQRQIRGQRFEWVPADVVHLYGKETFATVYVESDGLIGRVDLGTFKGTMELCPGLPIRYGDNVAQRVSDWSRTVPQATYADCELVFNRSANGNVLDDITSLKYRQRLVVVAGRAVSASVWR